RDRRPDLFPPRPEGDAGRSGAGAAGGVGRIGRGVAVATPLFRPRTAGRQRERGAGFSEVSRKATGRGCENRVAPSPPEERPPRPSSRSAAIQGGPERPMNPKYRDRGNDPALSLPSHRTTRGAPERRTPRYKQLLQGPAQR